MITDSQVRIAFKVYMQDEDYEPSTAGMRDMRTALEAAAVNGPWTEAATGDGWFVNGWKKDHPVHGTFFIGRLSCDGSFHANRVYADPSGENGLGCDRLSDGYFATLEAAHFAVAQRIAELDAALPAQDAAPAEVAP